ncbi:MAG TPA: 2Fe-2S ferredoxin, partial [Alphaproteobacteria bacterium]|nr:2Fe-2S ferredoxin [Alphaproteobacteria bacterium]
MPKVTFINADGTRVRVEAPMGETVLELAHEHGIN